MTFDLWLGGLTGSSPLKLIDITGLNASAR